MSDVPTNLRAVLLADSAVAAIVSTRVHQSVVPESVEAPYVWFTRDRSDGPRCLDNGVARNTEQQFSIECIAEDLSTSQTLADAVSAALDGKRGTFGDDTVQGVFVDDQTDDYIPRGVSSDDGAFVAALQVRIFS
jgi:hypothetical protein